MNNTTPDSSTNPIQAALSGVAGDVQNVISKTEESVSGKEVRFAPAQQVTRRSRRLSLEMMPLAPNVMQLRRAMQQLLAEKGQKLATDKDAILAQIQQLSRENPTFKARMVELERLKDCGLKPLEKTSNYEIGAVWLAAIQFISVKGKRPKPSLNNLPRSFQPAETLMSDHKAFQFGSTVKVITDQPPLKDLIEGARSAHADDAYVSLFGNSEGVGAKISFEPVEMRTGTEEEEENRESLNSEGSLRGDQLDEIIREARLLRIDLTGSGVGSNVGRREMLGSRQAYLWAAEQLARIRFWGATGSDDPNLPAIQEQEEQERFYVNLYQLMRRREQTGVRGYNIEYGGKKIGFIVSPLGFKFDYEPIPVLRALDDDFRWKDAAPGEIVPASRFDPRWDDHLEKVFGTADKIEHSLVELAQSLREKNPNKKKELPQESYYLCKLLSQQRKFMRCSKEFQLELHASRIQWARYESIRSIEREEQDQVFFENYLQNHVPEMWIEYTTVRTIQKEESSKESGSQLSTSSRDKLHACLAEMESRGIILDQATRDFAQWTNLKEYEMQILASSQRNERGEQKLREYLKEAKPKLHQQLLIIDAAQQPLSDAKFKVLKEAAGELAKGGIVIPAARLKALGLK